MYVFFHTCLHKGFKNACKCINLKRFLHVYCTQLPTSKLLTKRRFFMSCFFKLLSTKNLKMHSKCIDFKTVLASVLNAFTKVKIAHINDAFRCLFFLNLSPRSVSKRIQNALFSRRFLPVFSKHLPKSKLLTKNAVFCTFFSYLSSQRF